jgi:hypothetical protein
MRVLICGDRHWTNVERIRQVVKDLAPKLIIEGGAKGADRIAQQVGKELGIKVKEVNANWAAYGRAAGPIRNKKMLKLKPDLVIAFHNDIEKSKGTKNMLAQATAANIETTLYSEEGICY